MIENAAPGDGGRIPTRIAKPEAALRVRPNLGDYDAVRAAFSWARERERCASLPGGGLNIAHEAVDRHVDSACAERTAIRWIGKNATRREFSYRELAAATSRFANALRSLGVEPGERVFVLWAAYPSSMSRCSAR